MRRIETIVVLGILASVAACQPADRAGDARAMQAAPIAPGTAPTSAQDPVLSAQAYGEVRFGMRLIDAEQRLREPASPPDKKTGESGDCRVVAFKAYPQLRFMIERGIVTRADAFSTEHAPPARNVLGVAIGDTSAAVRASHPALKIRPHKYDPAGHYLIFGSADAGNALVIEEIDGKITAIRAGLEPSVEYVEGCS